MSLLSKLWYYLSGEAAHNMIKKRGDKSLLHSNTAKNDLEKYFLKAIELFIKKVLGYIFQLITDLLTYMINIFFNFAHTFQASTTFLGVIGFPVFIIGFALVGGVLYLIFRVVEELL